MSNPFSAWTPHPITSHNTTSTCPTDDDEDAALKLGLGAFIITGLLVSYLPQFLKIIKSKTSLGLSVWFLFLGSFGNVAIIATIVLQQAGNIACCFTESTLFSCIQNTLGFTQIFVQFLCFHYLISLFFIYHPKQPDTPLLHDPEFVRNLQVLRFMIYWGVAVALLVVACLVMQWETMTVGTMVGLGMVSLGMTLVQYLPQIWRTVKDRAPGALSVLTLIMQCPGNFILVYSISLQPGTDWTSWIAFLASGSFQFLLLLLCLFYSVTEREGYVRIPDAGAPPIVPEEGERRPLLGQGIEIEDDVERRG